MPQLRALLLQECRAYAGSFRLFSQNARLYLLASMFTAAGIAIQNVIYNLYLIRLGFDEVVVGQVATAVALGVAVSGIPAGIIFDRVGGKVTFSLSVICMAAAMTIRVMSQLPAWLVIGAVLNGVANSLYFVSIFPFLTGHSGLRERPHLFSSNIAVWTSFTMIGSLLAGYLPSLWERVLPPGSDIASIRYSLVTAAAVVLVAIIPLAFLQPKPRPETPSARRPVLGSPSSIGAMSAVALVLVLTGMTIGLTAPFMNVFFKKEFSASNPLIGAVFSMSQFMGLVSALIAPILIRRLGLVRTSMFLFLANIPFILCMGFPLPLMGIVPAFLFSIGLERMGDIPLMNLIMVVVHPSDRGKMSGIRLITNYGAQALAGLVGGAIILRVGYLGLFATAAVVNLLAGVTIGALFLRREIILENE